MSLTEDCTQTSGSRHKLDTKLQDAYQLSLSEYEELLKAQNYGCKICGKHSSENLSARWKSPSRLVVDHCHKTGKVRGLLCFLCNLGISYLQDSPEILERAAQYIKELN